MATEKVKDLTGFEFFDGKLSSHMNYVNSDIGGDRISILQLRADMFSNTIFDAVDEWDIATAEDPLVSAEKAKLLTIRTQGFVIGGVKFM